MKYVEIAKINIDGHDILRGIRRIKCLTVLDEDTGENTCTILVNGSVEKHGDHVEVYDRDGRLRLTSYSATPDRRAYTKFNHMDS